MNAALHVSRVVLVFINLVFVSITGVADPIWVVPLFGLTLAAPWLVRFADRTIYRVFWNGLVILVFLVLIHHTVTAGVRHVLEDGLRLAALCQVHLLNNLNRRQRPDLLFFNSFLIAVVTSLLCVDLEYCLVFLLYVPAFLTAMQLHAVMPGGSHAAATDPDLASSWRFPLRRQLAGSALRSILIVAVTMGVFAIAPRDFERKGLLAEQLRFGSGSRAQIGFDEGVSLTARGMTLATDEVVMTVTLLAGDAGDVPQYWRGATLDRFDGNEWRPAPMGTVRVGRGWRLVRPGAWVRAEPGRGTQVRVRLVDRSVRKLFIPLAAWGLVMESPERLIHLAVPLNDLTVLRPHPKRREDAAVYRLDLLQGGTGSGPLDERGVLGPHLDLPDNLPEAVDRVRSELVAPLATNATEAEVVETLRKGVSARFTYLPPGDPGAAGTLQQFLVGMGGGGHCEYFATTLAVLLRLQRIPCRVVTGFRSMEWDEAGRELTVRARDAHAWVEVFDATRGWYTVDATPAVVASGPSGSFFARARRFLEDTWRAVTSFDELHQARALAGLRAAWDGTRSWTLGGGWMAILGVVALVAGRRWRRRPHRPPAVRTYARVLRRAGLALAGGETPRELLERARCLSLDPQVLHRLESATETHERARFARGLPPGRR